MTCNSTFLLYSVLISSSAKFHTITSTLEDTDRHIFMVHCHSIHNLSNHQLKLTFNKTLRHTEFLKGFLGSWAMQT